MKKLLPLWVVLISLTVHAQNIGIGTNDPKSKLDITGGLSLREGPVLTLADGGASGGTNDNIVLPDITTGVKASFYRITGPTAAFSLFGIVPTTGADGQLVTLVNTTSQIMTIKNNASSTVTNGFKISGGNDLVSVAGGSSVTIQYNKTDLRWYVTGSQNFITPGTLSGVSVTSPLTSTGGSNPTISLGVVPVTLGGTGLTAVTAGQIPIGSGVNSYVNTTISSGTGINVVSAAGSITVNNTGDTDAANDITTSTTAGQDLTGNYPNPTVVGIQGRPVASTAPTNGQTIVWNNSLSRWEPGTPSGGTVSGTGTINYVPKWTSASDLSSTSSIFDNGNVGIGTNTPLGKFHVYNPSVYNGNENDNDVSSLVLYGSVENANGNHFGGITWASGGRKRAGISSVMENNDADYVGLAFWTQGTDGPGAMFESMRIARNGNVGLGTVSPAAKLHVNGGMRWGGTSAPYIYTDEDATGVYLEQVGTTTGNSKIRLQSSPSGSQSSYAQFFIDPVNGFSFVSAAGGNSGNVGIGTTTPGARLHVGGSNQEIRFDYNGTNSYYGSLRWAGLQFGNNGANRIIAGRTNTGGSLDFYVNNTNDAADYGVTPNGTLALQLSSAGLVRVPSLSVNSAVYTDGSGNLTSSAPGSGSVGYWTRSGSNLFPSTLTDKVGIRNNAPVYPLHVTLPDDGSLNGIRFEGNRSVFGGHAVRLEMWAPGSPAAADKKNFNIVNATAAPGYDFNTLQFSSVSDAGAGVANFITMAHSGNMGFGGISYPQKKVDALSTANDYITVGANTLGTGQWAGLHFGYREDNANYRKSAIVFERTDGAGFGNNATGKVHILNGPASGIGSATLADAKLTVGELGNIGIGTTTPARILTVNGGASNSRLLLQTTNSGTAINDGFDIVSYTTGAAAVWNYENANLGFATNNLERVTIDNTGNVGIGTTSPVDKLDVAGHVTLSGGGKEIRFRNSGGTTEQFVWHSGNSLGLGPGSGSNSMFVTSAGNVGIGTASPAQKLDVQGNIKLGDNMMVEGSSTARVYRNLVTYNHETDASPGVFIINTNQPYATDCMFRLKIEGYFYDATAPFEMTVAGYNYSGNNSFINMGYTNTGAKNLPVRFARNASNNIAVILGTDGASYSYPKLSVTSYHQGYCATSEAAADGWTITRATDASGLTLVHNVPDVTTIPSGSGNYIQNSTSLQSSANFNISGNGYVGGNVGVGTTNPQARLDVRRSADTDGDAIAFGTPTYFMGRLGESVTSNKVYLANTYNSDNSFIDFRLKGTAEANSKMIIKGDGKVGINTTNPATLLNVNVGAGDATVGTPAVRIGGTSNYQSLELGIKGAYDGMISTYGNDLHIYSGNWRSAGATATEDHKLWFYTSKSGSTNWNTAKMVLDANGNVGVGRTDPQQRLNLYSSGATLALVQSSDPAVKSGFRSSWGDGTSSVFELLYHPNNAEAFIQTSYAPAASTPYGDIVFRSDAYGTPRELMRLHNYTRNITMATGGGYVGIGTTNPSTNLDVVNTSSLGRIRVTGVSSGYTQADILLQTGTTDAPGARGTGIYTQNQGNNTTWYFGNPYSSSDEFVINRKSGTGLLVETAQKNASGVSNMLTITNTGAVLFKTPHTYGLVIDDDYTWGGTPTGDPVIRPSVNEYGMLGKPGYAWFGLYYYNNFGTSDIREKTDIYDSPYGLNEVMQMRPVHFKWKKRPETGEKVGLIAQEMLKIVPQVVSVPANPDTGTYGISYTDLVPVLINAVKEQQKQIEDIKQKNNEQIELLRKEVEELKRK